MTRHEVTRCVHCNARYAYQSSGYGCGAPTNDSKYCRTCKEVVIEALKAIPVRCRKIFVEVTDPDEKQKVLDKKKLDDENPPKLLGMPVRQIGGSLFRFDKAGRNVVATMHSIGVTLDGVTYFVEEWSDNSEPIKVQKPMERDLITELLSPWRD